MKRFKAILAISSALNLGKVGGIQLRIHYTWFIIFLLITYALAGQYFPDAYPGWTTITYWIVSIIAGLLFFASVVAHELAHSLVATASGVPVKSITLFIFGGIAQITREPAKARTELIIAVAGPASSLAIGGLFGLLWFLTQGLVEPVTTLFLWLAEANVLLAAFNLIPGFPLDGGRIFRSILWKFTDNYHCSTRIATLVGQGVGYLLILGGVLMVFLSSDWFNGLWLVLIGWFLASVAWFSYRQARWRERLVGLTASKVMTANYTITPPHVSVEKLIQQQVLINENLVFLVVDDGRIKGMVTLHNIQALPQPEWATTPIGVIMTPVFHMSHPDQDALSVMEQMEESGASQVPVVSEGRVVGIVGRDNLMKLLR